MSSDIFSLKAIENISISIHAWKETLNDGLRAYEKSEGEEYNFVVSPFWNIKLAGYITQQYTAKTQDGTRRPVKAYEKIIGQMPENINTYLSNLFEQHENYRPNLGEIPNLHSLIPLSQVANVPIFALKGKHGVVGAHFYKITEYSELLESVAEIFLSNLDVEV